ncbi:MAG TPA: thioredoxin family protein, partial [Polyangiaceae bacterium]|nr:thioredoxin family protein [Polyangiaceae bacterium]
ASEAAFAAARSSGKRVVLDLWAPWCHTCLSMQNFVITAENLPGAVDRFVWLAIDTEREQNAPLLTRLPVSVWPTFYVVDPSAGADPAIRGRWLGAASAAQFARFLEESDRNAELARNAASEGGATSALAQGDALAARGDLSEAARAYALALRQAPPDWPRRPETLVAQITALYKARAFGACLELGRGHWADTGNSASAVDFAAYALECADESPPGSEPAAELRRALVTRLTPLCESGSAELSPDDRADACDKLAAARSALGDTDGARRATLERLRILERAAEGKPPEVALTYDWARTDALLSLGRAEEALALASAREQQLPDNYNPPHYRAKSLKALGRWAEGLEAIERALSLAYGPRRIGLLTLKADLLLLGGRRADAVAVLEEQLAAYRALPAGQRQPAAEGRVEERLHGLAAPSASPRR